MAFKSGIKIIDKPTKLYVALINVGIDFDVDDQVNNDELLTTRCTENHSYKDCTVTEDDYKCANCNGDHAVVSKSCEELKKHLDNQTKPKLEKSNRPVPIGFTRNYSAATNKVNVQQSSLQETIVTK